MSLVKRNVGIIYAKIVKKNVPICLRYLGKTVDSFFRTRCNSGFKAARFYLKSHLVLLHKR